MAIKDGVGSTVWPGFGSTAAIVKDAVAVSNVDPGNAGRSATGVLRVFVFNSGANSDVEFQVSTSSGFGSLAFTTTLVNVPNGFASVQATGLTAGTTYYWRARAANTGTTGWSAWSGDNAATFANVGSSPTAYADGGNFGASFTPDKAYDGDPTGTFWHSSGAVPNYVQAQWAAGFVATRVGITLRNNTLPARSPKDFTLDGSNDGSTWTALATIVGYTGWTAVETFFALANATSYTYYRIRYTAHNGDANVAIANLRWQTTSGSTLTPWSFVYEAGPAKGFAYLYENVGAIATPDSRGEAYAYENVGFEITLDRRGEAYTYENVGFEVTLDGRGTWYVYEGDVDTSTPTPHIWFLIPSAGRPGDAIEIFGFGFGDLATTYNGIVQAYYGPSLGWQTLPVIDWQTFPPTGDAYGPLRFINEWLGELNVQHQVIQITVASDMLPPGYPLRVRTNGP